MTTITDRGRVPSEGERLAGLLYLPRRRTGHIPLIVMAGGWCYVKELVQPTFAEEFAKVGLGSLIFDYRYMGGSTGEPRQHIDPWQQIEDYRNAISYVGGPRRRRRASASAPGASPTAGATC